MSEIATGKLVIWMRLQAKRITPDGNSTSIMLSAAADRLEAQERDIETLRAFHERYAEQTSKKYVDDTCALTARAEQAEAREKAIIESLRDRCEFCIGYELEESDDPCSTCYNARTFEPDDIPRTKNWTWRGLPQEGERKSNG